MADPKLKGLQLNIEGLIRLLGGTAEDRARFWEIFKGVTTPIQLKLLNSQFDNLAASVKQIDVSTRALKSAAQDIAKGGRK